MNPKRVVLSDGVASVLTDVAIQGYEVTYKEERLGILLGGIQGNTAFVKRAIVYRGGSRTRTAIDVDPVHFVRRVRELSRKHKAVFLGTFHTHNEVGETISSVLSVEDRDHLCTDPPHIVELIVAIWRSNSSPRQGERYIQIKCGDYRLRIAGYQMNSPFSLIEVFSYGAD